ncbi:hypothetical protein MHU86_17795 [Fragilaria crotonensis]|nr:hypothetical protein MHU86_17795 [Fragilaria crotonensis]
MGIAALTSTTVGKNSNTISREVLREIFEEVVEREVRFNHWNLGCSDLTILAPYFRAISDKYFFEGKGNTRLIFGTFHKIVVGMCWIFAVPFKLISVEPSPQVFCELDDLAREKKWELPAQEMRRLNVALSDKTGYFTFRDPGHEGGVLLDGTDEELGPMTADFLQNVTKCVMSKETNHTLDNNRITVVPTFTMDFLVSSLKDLNIFQQNDDIFVLKIDTEDHDVNVLRGAKQLLRESA